LKQAAYLMNSSYQVLSNYRLIEALSTSKNAIAVHVTDKFNIQFATDAMLAIWGKGKDIIGLPLEEALPELKGQPFIEMFARVWNECITISGTDTLAKLEIDGVLQDFYFDFEYRAMPDATGKTYCIIHTATDVTQRVLSKRTEQNLTEELSAINEELHSANEELTASNEELIESQRALQKTYEDLMESDARFRNMVKQAPVGICIITANDLFIQDVNDAYLELVGKRRDELEGSTIWQAVPEAADFYAPIMNEVIRSGKAFIAREHELMLVRQGKEETVNVDFVYEPIRHTDGTVTGIMVLGFDVTDKVKARRSIEEVEERIRLAVDAAEIGTFDVDFVNNVTKTSEKFDQIFGFEHAVSRSDYASAIHPDDLEIRAKAFNHATKNKDNKLLYEVRVIWPDQSIHWIRAHGKLFYDENGKPVRMLGTVLDITQVKRLERQKDDFISIASHELKTPITSLKASLQLLDRMKDNPVPAVFPKLIDQSTRSMQKISALVDKLLSVGRANDPQLKLNKTTFLLADLLKNCCNHIRINNKYSLNTKGDLSIKVNADEHAIDQVVVNLVNNAVKYAPESFEIDMIIEKVDNMAKVSIKDYGAGIPAAKQPHLFDRYYQADATGFQNSGLGLGLYISAEIVRRHQGTVGVVSEVGQGSTFWFTLPLTD
jgi:PAS domain S-box-containing protein